MDSCIPCCHSSHRFAVLVLASCCCSQHTHHASVPLSLPSRSTSPCATIHILPPGPRHMILFFHRPDCFMYITITYTIRTTHRASSLPTLHQKAAVENRLQPCPAWSACCVDSRIAEVCAVGLKRFCDHRTSLWQFQGPVSLPMNRPVRRCAS